MGNCLGSGKEAVDGGGSNTRQRKELGTVIDVDGHSVKIVSVLGQGGFAVVFRAAASSGSAASEYALKKILAPSSDPQNVNQCRKEIGLMKQMKHCPQTVQLVASSEGVEGGFVQFWLLMELCDEGHVVDLMNTKISTKFTEAEVLAIFVDVVEAVVAMHGQTPPIAHRDIKPENVLKCGSGYKLCDFGSGSTKHATPGEERSVNNMSEDVDTNTTIQYRAPEQADLYSRKRVDERVDNWALGVFLYKLLFFDDAFGESSLAIVSGKYSIPVQHSYTAGVIDLMASMLVVDPDARATSPVILEKAKQLLNGGGGTRATATAAATAAAPTIATATAGASYNTFGEASAGGGATNNDAGSSWASFN